MKANEAPERIWIDPTSDLSKLSGHVDKDSVEYIRKDAFIDILEVKEIREEPVSCLDNGDMPIERWKQAVEAASNQKNYRSSKGLTETRDDYFVDGVQWADEHPKEEPVSEELEDAASSFARKDSEGISNPANFYYTVADKARIFKAGANWKKTKLMANATEVTVHIDAGGYPYIPQMELYDYDKDIPLAKEGDKYKVILIKEN